MIEAEMAGSGLPEGTFDFECLTEFFDDPEVMAALLESSINGEDASGPTMARVIDCMSLAILLEDSLAQSGIELSQESRWCLEDFDASTVIDPDTGVLNELALGGAMLDCLSTEELSALAG